MRLSLCLSLAILALARPLLADELIWVEGEAATASTMRGHSWYDSVKTAELSGEAWLSHFQKGETPVARYDFELETAGEYEFWLRANPIQSAISYRFDDGPWQAVPFEKKTDVRNLAKDGKPDLRYLAWVPAGKHRLAAGKRRLSVRFESRNQHHGALDCWVLSRESFLPQGRRQPGEKTGLADPGTWAFEPERDRFSKDALLDLSSLNEIPAGKRGRVGRSEDGASFVDGAGKPLRFWAVNTTVHHEGDLERVEEHARWLAKRGVNMVRHHGHLPPGRGSKLEDVNRRDIERAWRLVAAMKKAGIYTTLSPYWGSHTKHEASWDLPESGNGNLTGLLFFDAKLQRAYKGWLRALLASENPHTGIPLARDPALAIFQIQNEDSLLFWTEQSIEGAQRQALGRHFAEFLAGKYGSLAEARKAWGGGAAVEGDDFPRGLVMPEKIWHLTQPQRGARAKRLADQLECYAKLMRDFHAETERFLRQELGYEGLVNAGNWRTAYQAQLLDAERYAQSANAVIGVNRYYNGGGHENPTDQRRAGYLVSEGDTFSSESVLTRPHRFPLALRQVRGHPMIISESAWVPPLPYQSEGSFLVAAYGALTGVDIFYWFSTSEIGFGPPMGKWQLSTPVQLGMFPAAALMFRRGYIEEGKPVLRETRSLTKLYERERPLLAEEAGFDPNRDRTRESSSKESRLTPLAYLAGPVEVEFRATSERPDLAPLSRLIDERSKRVTSSTGEQVWHYGASYATLATPRAVGATGRLQAAGELTLGPVRLQSKNDYATVLVVSLDGRDLTESQKVLVQVGTVARPHGWRTSPMPGGGQKIDSLGSAPWNLVDTRLNLSLGNAHLSRATLLDANGEAEREVEVKRVGNQLELELPRDSLYLLLRSQ